MWSNLSELEPATTKTIIIQPLFSPSLTLLHYPLILTIVFQKPVFTKSAFMWCSKWCSYFHIVFFSQVHSKGNHGYTLYDRCISCGAWSRSITCSNAALFGAWSRSTIRAIWWSGTWIQSTTCSTTWLKTWWSALLKAPRYWLQQWIEVCWSSVWS